VTRFCTPNYRNRVDVAIGRTVIAVGLLLAAGAAPAGAQMAPRKTDPAPVEVRTLSEGWAALGRNDLESARKAAERALSEFPRSVAAVTLAIEVDISTGSGPLAGLTTYERWLGERKLEDPYILRRVARADLRSTIRVRQHPARLEAARALSADGDPQAAVLLGQGANGGGFAETRMLASLGHPGAVQALIADLRAPGGSKLGIINALVESRSKHAVAPLMELLSSPQEDHRAAAADALGRLGAAQAIPRLKQMLTDPVSPVRMTAASALYRLEDYSGVNLLEQMLTSEHPAVRLGGAEAMAVRPAGAWLSVVQELTNAADASVQLGAARLIAPYDPQRAASVLGRLQQSENPAVREEAGRVLVERVASDFTILRRYLRSPDGLTSVRAAARILELTR